MQRRLVTALTAVALCSCAGQTGPSPSVTVGETVYSGLSSDDGAVAAFLGVPFAEPPVGERRWMAPQPTDAGAQVIETRNFAPACMQGPHIVDWYRDLAEDFGASRDVVDAPDFSEDCLYLNIWTPDTEESADLPVMVWIHGGSNKGGWSYEPDYVGERLARRDVVVVTIAYRLGVFGYFSHPGLELSNFGLLDQAEALKWVQQNIGRFGGDPDNVTVFGESAGANSIIHLLTSPVSRGLFRRAIHQSAGSALLNRTSRAELIERGTRLGDRLLGGEADEGAIAALRAVPADALLDAADEVYTGVYFDNVIDGHSMIEPLLETLERGDVEPVDLMIGTNAHEWRMYLDPLTNHADVEAWLQQNAPDTKDRLLAALGETAEPRHALDRLITAQQYVCPSLLLAEKIEEAGGTPRVYYFSRQRTGDRAKEVGAYHGAEYSYVFDNHDAWLPTTDKDRDIGNAMGQYWARFAASGDPTYPGGTPWPAFDSGHATTLEIGDSIRSIEHPEKALCESLTPRLDQGADTEKL